MNKALNKQCNNLFEKIFIALLCLFFVANIHCMDSTDEFYVEGVSDNISGITLTEFTNQCFKTVPECNLPYTSNDDEFTKENDLSFSKTFLSASQFKFLLRKFISTFAQKDPEKFFSPSGRPITQDLANQISSPCEAKSISENCYVATIGDQHGSVHSSLRNLWELVNNPNVSLDNNFRIKNNSIVVFNGDYVDRGHHSVETLALCILLKLANPDKVFLIRGNHEDEKYYIHDGLSKELAIKFGEIETEEIKPLLNVFFSMLPSALILKYKSQEVPDIPSKNILFCHGGIPIFETEAGQLVALNLSRFIRSNKKYFPLSKDVVSSFTFSDFFQSQATNNKFIFNHSRGGGFAADLERAQKWMVASDIFMIIRGHQHGNYNVKLLFKNQADLNKHINTHVIGIDVVYNMNIYLAKLTKMAEIDNPTSDKIVVMAKLFAQNLKDYISALGPDLDPEYSGEWLTDASKFINDIEHQPSPETPNSSQEILTTYVQAVFAKYQSTLLYKALLTNFLKFVLEKDIVLNDNSQSTPANWKDVVKEDDVDADGLKIENIARIITLSTATEGVGLAANGLCVLKITPAIADWRLKIYETNLQHGMPVRTNTADPIVQKYATISPGTPRTTMPYSYIQANWTDEPTEEPIAQTLIDKAAENIRLNNVRQEISPGS